MLSTACGHRQPIESISAEQSSPPTTQQVTPPPPEPPAEQAEPASETITLAEGLRLNRTERWIELDGFVPIDVRETDRIGFTLIRYLECIVVTPTSGKDHEALMVTSVRPSTIHAALLTLGLEPGKPGSVRWDGTAIISSPASGGSVTITYRTADQPPPGVPITDFITHADTGEPFAAPPLTESPQWVFAGSLLLGDRYVADAEGLVVGLHTFGSELIALETAISPDSFIEEPRWIAHPERTPPFGTEAIVRITARN
ncbi:MAG: YdjY domain-containing protein [Phycisphaerales bacterium]